MHTHTDLLLRADAAIVATQRINALLDSEEITPSIKPAIQTFVSINKSYDLISVGAKLPDGEEFFYYSFTNGEFQHFDVEHLIEDVIGKFFLAWVKAAAKAATAPLRNELAKAQARIEELEAEQNVDPSDLQ